MDPGDLNRLQLGSEAKHRPKRFPLGVVIVVAVATGIALYFAWPGKDGQRRVFKRPGQAGTNAPSQATNLASDAILTVSGYIINRERIELSPRFLGVVKWIGVKKGDAVTNGQVVVLLDDSEQKARMAEAEGTLANAQVAVVKAELDYERVKQLARTDIESKQAVDNARLQLDAARATLQQTQGTLDLARTYLEWTVIRAPINGVVLEKLVDPNELVVPQSFGGTRGPSTALLALADSKDVQVEIDLNESDLAKVFLKQRCRISPEAYPDKRYDGHVAEIAPEANRQKGTLQVKVQIHDPDRFLTPELSARVDFLKGDGGSASH